VVQGSQKLRFPLKTSQTLPIGSYSGREDFEGDIPPQFRVVSPIDFAHAARPDLLQDRIVRDSAADEVKRWDCHFILREKIPLVRSPRSSSISRLHK
jgi:hypothetical protein